MPHPPLLSIVIPAFNEEIRLPSTLSSIGSYLAAKGLDAEIIVVDDGSTDGTVRIVEQARQGGLGRARVEGPATPTTEGVRFDPERIRLVRNPENRGKGYSIRHGMFEARGTWVLFTDADLSTPIEDFERLHDSAREGDHDIVIGSRALPESRIELYQPLYRVLMGQTFNRIVRWIAGLPFRDTQCGFKLMGRERVRPLFERMVVDRFAFDVELLFLARHAGLSIAEVPVTWRNSPVSKVGLLRDPLNMLSDTWRIRRRFQRGDYRKAAVGKERLVP